DPKSSASASSATLADVGRRIPQCRSAAWAFRQSRRGVMSTAARRAAGPGESGSRDGRPADHRVEPAEITRAERGRVGIARLEPALDIEGPDEELAEILRAVAEGLALVEEQARGEEVIEKVRHGLGLELSFLAGESPPAVEAAPEGLDGLDDGVDPRLGRGLRHLLEPGAHEGEEGLVALLAHDGALDVKGHDGRGALPDRAQIGVAHESR